MRRLARPRLLAAGLTLFILLLFAGTARCMSARAASCSLGTLWSGSPPLDVPYAGTRPEVVALMLDMAAVGPGDHVVDLGTGDGRILLAAARRGAGGEGVDLDPVLIARARRSAEQAGLAGRVAFRTEDLFRTPLGEASVVTMFLLPEVNLRLRPRILADMQPGARIVSHAFDMADWQPDAQGRAGGARVYLWVVPARIAGRWRLRTAEGDTAVLELTQQYQRIGGRLVWPGADAVPITDAHLAGACIRFVVDLGGGPRRFEGVVQGNAIIADDASWRADRIDPSEASEGKRAPAACAPPAVQTG